MRPLAHVQSVVNTAGTYGCASDAVAPDQYSKPAPVFQGVEELYDALNVHTYSMIEGYPTWRRVWPEHEGIAMFEYVNPEKPGQPVWAVWSPTGSQREVVKRIAIPGKVVKAEAMPLQAGEPRTVEFKAGAGFVDLPVTESPVYLRLEQKP
jgi:serine/threonine-protein kinase ATR